MKQLFATASNVMLIPTAEGKIRPSAEFIIVTTEPSYRIAQQEGEDVERYQSVETFRFALHLGSVPKLRQALEEVERSMLDLVKETGVVAS